MDNKKKSYETPEIIRVNHGDQSDPNPCHIKGETETSPFDGCIFSN